jgi:RHS repeat-associated protein
MKTFKLVLQLALMVAVCCGSPAVLAQSPATGFPPYGSFQPGGFDAINLQDLNVNFGVPIIGSQGRGISLRFRLNYDSSIWKKTSSTWTPINDENGNPTWGWRNIGPMGTVSYYGAIDPSCGYAMHYYAFQFVEPNGTVHPFGISYYSGGSCGGTSGSAYASDGSGFYMSSSGGVSTVTMPNGFKQTSSALYDQNGNYVSPTVVSSSETDWIDSVGRTALKITTSSGSISYQWLSPTGSYNTTTVLSQSYNIKTNFGCSGMVEYTGTATLPYEIDLPNGKKYLFTYEDTPNFSGYTTGRLKRLTLPSGGYYEYAYSGSNGGINCADGSAMTMTRVINDGTTSNSWQYARTGVTGLAGTTTVTEPQMPYDSAANQCTYTFDSSGHETQEKHYQGSASGTPLRQVDFTRTSDGSPATQVITLETGQKSEVDTTYDSNGNLTQAKEYDLGTSSPGSLVRETDWTFTSAPPFLITQRLVKDSSGAVKSREDRAYDGTTPTSVTGAAHHDDSGYGTSFNSRGNLTSITTYSTPATPSGGITAAFTYDTLGNLLTISVASTQQKQFNYSSTTQYSQPDSIVSGPSSGPQLTQSFTYNAYTGAIATLTNENGQVTSYTYDAYRRLTTVTRPDSIQLTTSYDETNNIVTSTSPIDSTHSASQMAAFDGLGRTVNTTIKDASGTPYSIVQTQYDPVGRLYKSSNPFTGSSPSYWSIAEFDGLGRPIANILPDGSQSTVSYTGNSVMSTDPSGLQRKSFFDGLGRMIEVDEPSATVTLAPGSGSGTASGTEQYHAATGATSGTGTITITGTEQSDTENNPTYDCVLYDEGGSCLQWQWVDHYTTYYDQGDVRITANGHSNTVTYANGSSASTIASALASAINGDSGASVTASASGAVVTLTSKTTGTGGNYSFSATSWTTDTTGHFGGPSFGASPSGNILTGGGPATSSTYDTGSVSVTIDGTQVSVTYGSSSTASGIASALTSAINSASMTHVTASASGTTITLTASTSGAATNYSISSHSTTDYPSFFSSPSFTIAMSGPALTGGAGPDSWSSPVQTTYTYDLMDQITGVTEGSQTRSNTYDGMGRLTQAISPEAGTVSRTYNTFGLVASATDARGVVTNFSYDTLNRLTQVSYNVGSTGVASRSTVTYTYGTSSSSNNNGRLSQMTDGLGSESYTYDILGRTTQLSKVVGSTTYTTSYSFNLGNELTQITYPSGRTVVQNYDAIGRICSITGSATGCSPSTYYASGLTFNTAGEMTAMNFGNGVSASFGYSADRLQLTSLSYTKSSTTLFSLNYSYGSAGSNNGMIAGITDNIDSGRSATYTYDGLGRISRAYTAGSTAFPAWDLSWTYDRYGNRLSQAITSGTSACSGITCPTNSVSVSTTANQITDSGYSYDSSGNMTHDGYNTLTYDAASSLISASNTSNSADYAYDGNGLRVKKCVPSCSSSTTTTVYIFSGSKIMAEYENAAAVGSPTREYIYSGGGLLATIDSSGTKYHHSDHLSARLNTDSSGNKIGDQGHFPFGEPWYEMNTTTKWKFTSYERDLETGNGGGTGNDYAMARYNVNRLGRFSSPDPLGGNIGAPQSLNRYSYTHNNPINLVDPMGLCEDDEKGGNKPCPMMADWGSDDGLGACTLDRMSVPCGYLNGLIRNGMVAPCPDGDCSGVEVYDNGKGGNEYRFLIYTWRVSRSNDWRGMPIQPDDEHAPNEYYYKGTLGLGWSKVNIGVLRFLNTVGGNFSVPAPVAPQSNAGSGGGGGWESIPLPQRMGVLSSAGTIAGPVDTVSFWALWFGASAGVAVGGFTVFDYAAGAWDSLVFGRGGLGILNSNSWLRLGFGWNGITGQMVFRLAGFVIKFLTDSKHIDLWNVK